MIGPNMALHLILVEIRPSWYRHVSPARGRRNTEIKIPFLCCWYCFETQTCYRNAWFWHVLPVVLYFFPPKTFHCTIFLAISFASGSRCRHLRVFIIVRLAWWGKELGPTEIKEKKLHVQSGKFDSYNRVAGSLPIPKDLMCPPSLKFWAITIAFLRDIVLSWV